MMKSDINAYIGEKEKAVELANRYPESKNAMLCIAFRYNYHDDYIMYSQKLIIDGLHNLTYQLPRRADNLETKKKAVEKLIDLYEFVFRGDYGFYNTYLCSLYEDYAELLIEENRIDAALDMLESYLDYYRGMVAVQRKGDYSSMNEFMEDRMASVAENHKVFSENPFYISRDYDMRMSQIKTEWHSIKQLY